VFNRLRAQRTLARTVSLAGVGYWSDADVTVEFRPAMPDTGLVFRRVDLDSRVLIPADVTYRREIPRRTALHRDGVQVEMVEHILAALAGLRIDNCEIFVDAQEMPAFDGSCQALVGLLQSAGVVEQSRCRATLVIDRPLRVEGDGCWILAEPSISPELVLCYELDYGPSNPIGHQAYSLRIDPANFVRELASARTFVLAAEAAAIQAQGLAKRVSHSDLLVFGPHGPIGNELRFKDECVRHKLLDLVGDLALAGCDFCGRITAYRSGHRLNAELVSVLLENLSAPHIYRKTA
jgi:UDP-3-O-[3-hydroxymyristoyl] N-acetylglucosamine deacetylase